MKKKIIVLMVALTLISVFALTTAGCANQNRELTIREVAEAFEYVGFEVTTEGSMLIATRLGLERFDTFTLFMLSTPAGAQHMYALVNETMLQPGITAYYYNTMVWFGSYESLAVFLNLAFPI